MVGSWSSNGITQESPFYSVWLTQHQSWWSWAWCWRPQGWCPSSLAPPLCPSWGQRIAARTLGLYQREEICALWQPSLQLLPHFLWYERTHQGGGLSLEKGRPASSSLQPSWKMLRLAQQSWSELNVWRKLAQSREQGESAGQIPTAVFPGWKLNWSLCDWKMAKWNCTEVCRVFVFIKIFTNYKYTWQDTEAERVLWAETWTERVGESFLRTCSCLKNQHKVLFHLARCKQDHERPISATWGALNNWMVVVC